MKKLKTNAKRVCVATMKEQVYDYKNVNKRNLKHKNVISESGRHKRATGLKG